LHQLSEIQREQGSANCVDGYLEALSLAEQIQDSQAAAVCAFNLGHAYEGLPGIRDLALAEGWYQRSLDRNAKEDRMGRAGCLGQLGTVAHRRFLDARKAGRPLEECLGHFSRAEQHYLRALEITPPNAVRYLATNHHQLGLLYADVGQIDLALRHCRESIRYKEAMQDSFGAGQSRESAALALARAGRFADARDWAQSALRDYQACENADERLVNTLKLLGEIESALQATPPPS
jgi:tetratricopeptide (TPR) repeat protein